MAESSEKLTALLLGATGLVGRRCLELLQADPRIEQVVTLTRRPLAVPGSGHSNHVIDFNRPKTYRDKVCADIVICTLGTTIKKAGSRETFRRVDFDYACNLARAALTGGARHFLLVSAKGAAADSRFFYNRVKGELEDALADMGFEGLSIFRPSLLKGNRAEFRAGETGGLLLAGLFGFLLPDAWKPTPVDNLAAAIVQTACTFRPGKRVFESDAILHGLVG